MPETPDGGDSKTPSSEKDGSSKGRWFKKPAVWAGALVTAVITGVLVNLATGAVSHAGQSGPAPNIEVDGMTAQYVPFHSGIPERPVKLDFEIRNTGNQLAIIRAVRVTIQQYAALPVCFSAGALVSTGTYHAVLPVNPSPGTSIDIPTAQQVAPDAADRFDVTLGLPVKRPPEAVYVYRVRLGLLYDNSGVPADAGEAVIALPIAPYDSYFWTKQFAAHPASIPVVISAAQAPSASRCLVSNSRKLHPILAMAGARPGQLSAVQSQLSTCCGWTMPVVKAQQVCGPALERPAAMALSCDGTGALESMKWSAWTSSYAQGTGIYRAQSCNPDCASGKVRYYNVNVRFDMPTDTSKNGLIWNRATLEFPNGSPDSRGTIVLTNFVGTQ